MERNKSLKAAPVDAPDFFGKRLAGGLVLVRGLALVGAALRFAFDATLVGGLVGFMTIGIELGRTSQSVHVLQGLPRPTSRNAIVHICSFGGAGASPISLKICTQIFAGNLRHAQQ